jgi:hypothetical protein
MTPTVQRIDLPVLAVPTEALHSKDSNLFQCSVLVQKNKFVMYYQQPDGSETAVLRADKQKTIRILPKYHIFDISNCEGGAVVPLEKATNTSVYLGKVRREKDRRSHSFSLHSERESMHVSARKTMHVLYDLPTVLASALPFGKEPPRRVQLALYHEASDSSERGNGLADAVAASIQETGFLDRVADPASGLLTFSHKEPYKTKNGDFALNFYGRCQLPHPANIQMEDGNGQVVIQVCQRDDDKFSLDFRAPLNAFQAFGFAVAQLCDY